MCDLARKRGAALHLDGARLWQCEPFYGRPLAELAGLFDSVYVSFYKDLGAPAGCALAGSQALVDEARVWQVRHGGRLFSVYPLLLAAERGLDEVLPRMPLYVERAQELAAGLTEHDGIEAVIPPAAAMFHLHVRRDRERLREAALDLAEETGVWVAGGGWFPSELPAVQVTELTITEASLDVPVEEVSELWAELLRRSS